MAGLDENFLLEKLNAGHYDAFTALYDLYWEETFLYTQRLVGHEEEAEDIVQETFITLWNLRGKLEGIRSFKAYTLTIARNKALKHLRESKKSELIDDFTAFLQDHEPSALDSLIKKELASFVKNEVERLPDRMKETYQKSREEGLSNREIAAVMGISDQTVKKQINNSLKQLRVRLSKFYNLHIFGLFF